MNTFTVSFGVRGQLEVVAKTLFHKAVIAFFNHRLQVFSKTLRRIAKYRAPASGRKSPVMFCLSFKERRFLSAR